MVLTTEAYPYGTGETFLANEIPYLANHFEQIIIVPAHPIGTVRKTPENGFVRLVTFSSQNPIRSMVKQFGWNAFKQLFRCWKNEVAVGGVPFYAMKKWKTRWLDLINEHYKGLQLVNQIPELKQQNTILYHFWMTDFARYFSWVKQSGVIANKQVCRIHGFDFNPTRHPKGHFPFREAELSGYDRIVAASEFALKYMSKSNPKVTDKLVLHRLGINIPKLTSHSLPTKEGEWCFASCSNIFPEKRVDFIVKAMVFVAKKKPLVSFQWHHFGGGPTLFQLQEQAKQFNLANLAIHFHGNTPNEEVLNFYKSHEVDAFIHASATEGGCPVAIQEAMSYGIPLIGIVNEGAAEMKLNDFTEVHSDSLENLCNILVNFVQTDDQTRKTLKQEALHAAKIKYAASQNYPTFIQSELIC